MTFMWGKKYVGKTSISLKKHFHSTPFQFLKRSFEQEFCAVPFVMCQWNCLEAPHPKPGLRLPLDAALPSPVRQVLAEPVHWKGNAILGLHVQDIPSAFLWFPSARWFLVATLGSFSPITRLIKKSWTGWHCSSWALGLSTEKEQQVLARPCSGPPALCSQSLWVGGKENAWGLPWPLTVRGQGTARTFAVRNLFNGSWPEPTTFFSLTTTRAAWEPLAAVSRWVQQGPGRKWELIFGHLLSFEPSLCLRAV